MRQRSPLLDPGPAPEHPIRVFLLDDHEVVRRGLTTLLHAEPDLTVVGEAGRTVGALDRVTRCRPDVAVIDARLPDGNGIDVCRDIRSAHPDIGCLILTSYDDDEALVAAVLAGAAGYLLKEVRGASLVDSIRTVAAGHSIMNPHETSRVRDRMRASEPVDPRVAELTTRERQVLEHITDGMTNRQIAVAMGLTEKTIKNYVSGLLAKLGMARRTQAAVLGSQIHGG